MNKIVKTTGWSKLPIENYSDILKKYGLTFAWICLVEEYLKELLKNKQGRTLTLGRLIRKLKFSN